MEVELQPKQNLHWDKGRPLSLSTDEPLRREAHASPWPIQPESPGLRQQEEPGFRSVRSVFIPIPKKGEAQERSNHRTIALTSHTSKGTLKTLQARLQQYVNRELADVQAGFRKGRGTRDQIANIRRIIEKAREFQKNIYFCFIKYAKAFDCVDHNKMENSERDGNTSPPDLVLEKSVCRSGSNSYNWTWSNRLVSNRKIITSRLYIVTLPI